MVRIFGAFFCMALVSTLGCGPESKMTKVTGIVTIDGAMPDSGSISFIPVDGMTPTAGAVIEKGKYTSEAPIGESKVEIRVPKVVGKKKLYDTPNSPEQNIMEEVLPPKYNEETELRFTGVKGKLNEQNFELSIKKS